MNDLKPGDTLLWYHKHRTKEAIFHSYCQSNGAKYKNRGIWVWVDGTLKLVVSSRLERPKV